MDQRVRGIFYIAPAFVIIFMFLILPVLFGFYFSLFDAQFLTLKKFIGLKNFIHVLQNVDVTESLGRTLLISLIGVFLTILVGFSIAYWSHISKSLFGYIIQTTTLIPWITSMVVGALLWKWIFASDIGLFNYLRFLVGLRPTHPLGVASSALASLIFVLVWRTLGYAMVMILAGLKTVPKELIEASLVDGCNLIQRIRYIILPTIATQLLVAIIVLTLSNFNNATVPLVLTGGGPARATNVVALELYRMAFMYNRFSDGSTLAVIIFLINVILIALYMKIGRQGL